MELTSFDKERFLGSIERLSFTLCRPSSIFKPALSRDGNQYCALYGENLVEGCAGFGDSPEDAMEDFDRNWRHTKDWKHRKL